MQNGLIEKLGLEVQTSPSAIAARWTAAAHAIEQIAEARSLDDLVAILRGSARRVVGADGITVVLREGDFCHYIAEDSQEPLWAGQRFPAKTCVSGWAMTYGKTAAIPDVFADPRVPHDAYRTTYVRSMLMVPIGRTDPVAAVGAYWSITGQPSENEIALLETLARAASTALENGRLLTSLQQLNAELEDRVVARTAELERVQAVVRQTQKMEVIGQLTGNVAHDFNNLLSPIMSSLDLVLGGRANQDVVRRSAIVAMEATESAKTLVQRLLAFARRQPLVTGAVDLAALVEGMQALLLSTVGSRIRLELRLSPELPPVRADKHQLELAILNLAVNARDAMPAGGNLTISALQASAPLPAGFAAGGYLRLVVQDTGTGMDARTLAAATEPFFTTKDAGHGTGLGLSMVEGLASQLGGALELHSVMGEGTKVGLVLPIARVAPIVEAPEVLAQPGRRRGSVLLVDDDALVRMGTCDMLEDLGYDVVEAEDARAALAALDGGLRPDIVVTDHLMPGMTGAELALRLRTDHPEIAVMIVSGYQGIELIAPDVVRLSKPFRQVHLGASIEAALNQVEVTRA